MSIHFEPAHRIAALLLSKQIGFEELIQEQFRHIDRYNEYINALVVDHREEALNEARALDALPVAVPRTSLLGIPLSVKESFNVKGLATTWGNPDWRENVASDDAQAVVALKRSGANLIGKTNVSYLLADYQCSNPVFGRTNNPYDGARSPGGSSGGSAAAIAAGFSALELGSDIGGSIRNPAHYCGVFGHKPTWGLLASRGHCGPGEHLSVPDIAVIGPIARSATDLAVAMDTLLEHGSIGPARRLQTLQMPTSQLRVAVWANETVAPVSREVERCVARVATALQDDGAEVSFEARPGFGAPEARDVYFQLVGASMGMSRLTDQMFGELVRQRNGFEEDDQSPFATQIRNVTMHFRTWKQLDERRAKMRSLWDQFFSSYDFLLAPVMSTSAILHDDRPVEERRMIVDGNPRPYFEQIFWGGLSGVSYLPSTVVPASTAGELPIGIQIIGPEYGDLLTIDLAQRLERTGFRFVAPALDGLRA